MLWCDLACVRAALGAFSLVLFSIVPLISLFGAQHYIASLGGFPIIGSGQGVIKFLALLAIAITLWRWPLAKAAEQFWLNFLPVGLVLALALPMLLLAAMVKHDPRARTPLQIERDAGLPVLGTIPLHHNRKQQAVVSRRYFLAIAVLLSIPVVYGLVLAARMVNGS